MQSHFRRFDSKLLDGWIDPDPLPAWLSEDDLDYYTAEFEESGFRGPLNRYRAQARDWELLPQLSELKIILPSYFIGGELDFVRHLLSAVDLFETPGEACTDFRGKAIIPGVGHWVQQEAPEQINHELLKFLRELG